MKKLDEKEKIIKEAFEKTSMFQLPFRAILKIVIVISMLAFLAYKAVTTG